MPEKEDMANTRDRKNYGSEFKAKVAMEAVAGRLTINEIAKRHEIHPVQVSKWKKQFLEAVPGIFDSTNKRPAGVDEELTDQLYQQIGKLKVELDWLKKKSALFG